ncbi:helix-turn-helix domain-containing protein [Streptomyces lydicus]|uniref:helix-turn-helix domain-containing protein n=1 Tax=Streptomyces lydicus TaxID=47763 RepID=UPI00343FAE1F
MPRWKPLPEELDPQVREFAARLRRLVDRSGLSVSALADRTGFSKTSWERYLNGRLLPPRRAVLALAEATGTHTGHLTTLWELAERAWSRAEMRQDVTMEAIRVAQARAALGEFETPSGQERSSTHATGAAPSGTAGASAGHGNSGASASPNGQAGTSARGVEVAAQRETAAAPWAASVPLQRGAREPAPGDFPGREGEVTRAAPAAAPAAAPGADGVDGGDGADRRTRGRRAVAWAVGAVGALLVAVAAVLLLHPDAAEGSRTAAAPPAPPATSGVRPVLPAGVRCSGADCAGKDPEAMGCGGTRATSASRGTAGGALIEVRYSTVCRAAWARISGAAPGDRATVSAGGRRVTARVRRDGAAYTAMVQVTGDPAKVSACGTTAAGANVCARPVPARAAAR